MATTTSTNTTAAEQATSHTLTPLTAFGLLFGVVVVIAIYLVICHFLGIEQFWSGFLFVLYWGMVEKAETVRLPHVILGGLVGMLAGYGTHLLPEHLAGLGGYLALGFIVVVIYCQLMAWLPMAVNMMTMIFLTVSTIPAVLQHTLLLDVMIGFGAGIVFFAGFILTGKMLKSWRKSTI